MKKIPAFSHGVILGAVIGLAVGFIIPSLTMRSNEQMRPQDYVTTVIDGEQTELRIPFDSNSFLPFIIPSPDEKTLLYLTWENSGFNFYLTDIRGSYNEFLVRQHATEGSGQLLRDSIAWSSDGKFISFREDALTCASHCDSPADFVSVRYEFTVNIATKEETQILAQ